MSDGYKPICVEQILVSLDSSLHSFAALKSAVELAQHYDAKLQGVFIEDVTLLSLAEMPFRQEVGEYSAIVRDISADGMTRSIFVQSRWVVRTFQKMVNQTELQGDFSILRGKVAEIIDQEARKCDLLIIGKTGTNLVGRRRLGSTARALIQKVQKPLLLVEEGNRLGYPVIVLFDDSPLGKTSLETAADLTDPGERLIIFLNEDDTGEFQKNKKALQRWSEDKRIDITIQSYKTRSFTRFIRMIEGLKTGLLVLPHLEDPSKRPYIEYCLKEVSLTILLIHQPVEKEIDP